MSKQYLSNCCGAPIYDYPDQDFCSDCKEHCEPQEECSECHEPMDVTDTNFGTEDILVCIHCYNDAQK